MKNRKKRLLVKILAIFLCLPVGMNIYGQSFGVRNLDADTHTERGLILSEHPLSHLITLQKWELIGLPKIDTLTKKEKLKLAEKEFFLAIKKKKTLKEGYSLGQVFFFLANAESQLAVEYRKDYEEQNLERLQNLSMFYFSKSFQNYEFALKNISSDLRYTVALDLTQAIISSGNLNKALNFINRAEKENLHPSYGADYGLIRFKAEIYWIMGRNIESGLAYEDWIDKGGAEYSLKEASLIYQRLRYLKEKTGHPINFVAKQ